MTNTLAEQAVRRARYQSANGPQFGEGECMMRNRLLVDAPAIGDYDHDGSADAEDGWKFAKHKHPTTHASTIPGGAFVWWGGGSHDHGHVAFTDLDKPGWCWSTDIKRIGYFDLVPITLIAERWGLPLLGWSEDIDGVQVYQATPDNRPTVPTTPPTTQEDDMPTPADVWHERIGEKALPKTNGVYAEVALATVYAKALELDEKVDRLTTLVESLISGEHK